MKSEWVKCKISDLGDVVGGATPSTKDARNYENGTVAWITPKDLSGYQDRYISHGERNITSYAVKNSGVQLMPRHSILFSSRAPIGYVAIANDEVCTNQGFKSVVPYETTDFMFLYYLLIFNRNMIERQASGTTFMEVSGKTMRNIEVSVPSLPTQKKIAAILSALDAKIENNNAINRNLEQQAQAIFKSWFVDFEPFGGKMPEGWRVGRLADYYEIINGYAFKSSELLSSDVGNCYCVFKQGHIARGGGFNVDGTKSWYPKSLCTNLTKYVLNRSDVLMATTDMKNNVAILGNTALLPESDKYVLNQRVILLRPFNNVVLNYAYVYLLTNNEEYLSDLRSKAHSGVQVNLSISDVKEIKINIADKKTNTMFDKIVTPMMETIMDNTIENTRLAALRDALLPKLMSGEIEV